MPLPRAYLIDSSIYIFRAWHVYDDAITDSNGNPSNAVFGFSDFLYQLIRQKSPQYIACAFDSSQTESYRRELYPDYKANRPPAPPELKQQFERCRAFCQAVGIPAFGSNRYEADDIIGSLASYFREQGFAITVVSADKDLTQLILGEEDAWWDFARGTVLNRRGVEKQFGVKPEQIPDMLALSGDKIDNIPGIPGVGYTTASKILKKFPSIDLILENIEAVAEMKFRGASRIHALLNAHREMLPLNKKLTTVVCDMHLQDHLQLVMEKMSWSGIDQDAFSTIIEELALSSGLSQRWLKL
ncbi:MAG: flap endonuclease [Gammaproteobacteria bacterium]|nr:flap endonuclease [Gammaproteobacteria bacterium]MAY01763.1 flap endonuclease [Gammaproteobacteria bacterium]|tara:strand:+ start:978 stop:1877 length:900 start_codon:yes stop_codon:yes gene_type:complete